jgi:NTP pyrophosphatase (non-canonical NTP hydrolase)
MKVKAFEEFVASNAKQKIDQSVYSFVGLAGETGEVMEWFKKSVLRGDTRFTTEMLLLELGDVLHYVSRIGQAYGWTLKDIMEANVDKLEARFNK